MPDERQRTAPIVETVVTTTGADGAVNCAAMGVEWGEDAVVVKPWHGTRTLRNLRERPAAVLHLTDDILLFCEAALGDPRPPVHPARAVDGFVLDDACSWRELRVRSLDAEGERARVVMDVVARGSGREYVGFSRAAAAALEASIVASRLRLLPAAQVHAELDRLQDIVDRTAGPRERAAMDLVRAHVVARIGAR